LQHWFWKRGRDRRKLADGEDYNLSDKSLGLRGKVHRFH